MIARNVTHGELTQALMDMNATHEQDGTPTGNQYAGNVRFKNGPTILGKGFRFTLTVNKAAAAGGRRSNTGRKIAAACWHAHRDYMRALYAINPAAVIKTAFITYTSAEDFEENHGDTGNRNIGSQFNPMTYREACECSH